MAYAKGTHAFGYCDRTGFRYPLKDLVEEYRNGVKTGMRIGRDVVDPDHPQNFVGRLKISDPLALRNPRPDMSMEESRRLFGWAPVGNPAQTVVTSVGKVAVSITDGD